MRFILSTILSFIPFVAQAQGLSPVEERMGVAIDVAPVRAAGNQITKTAHVFSFDFTNPQIELNQILDGGLLPDGIPTILTPKFQKVTENTVLKDEDRIIGLKINGEVKAYPVRILNWHQGVQDRVGGHPVLVSWDALSGHATAFERQYGRLALTFGVSGMVYKSSTLYFDQDTQSLWSPLLGKAVTGEMAGRPLRFYPVFLTSWAAFKETYPNAEVLSIDTGFKRDYTVNPYGDYAHSKALKFPVHYYSDALARKEVVIGVHLRDGAHIVSAAIDLNSFLMSKEGVFDFTFNKGTDHEIPLTVVHDDPVGAVKITTKEGVSASLSYLYWFAWSAFNPDTFVIQDFP